MDLTPLQKPVSARDIPPERLAANTSLSEKEKIGEASRQFEAILIRQILEASQKTVIHSKFSDNSTAGSIYRDLVTNQLADSISKSGSFGLAKIFEQQLNRPGSDESDDDGEEAAALQSTAAKAAPHAVPGQNIPRTHAPLFKVISTSF